MADTPTYISGLRATNDFATDERPKNFREAILWLDPNGMTPLTAMSAKMKTENTDDPEFAWFEEVLDTKKARITAKSGAETAGTTNTWTIANITAVGSVGLQVTTPSRQFKPGDLLQVFDASAGQPATYSTGAEIVEVVSVTATTIDVIRGKAGTVVVIDDTLDNDEIRLVGSAYAEGALSPDGRASQPQKNLNYTQIFKTAFSLTNTTKQTRFRTGDAFENDRKRAMFAHSEAMEQAFLWGNRFITAGTPEADYSATTGPQRGMGGLRFFFTSNVNVNVGAVTDDFFFDSISSLFNYNAGGAGDQRICFVGNGALNAFQKAFRDSSPVRITYQGAVKFYGLKLLEFQIPQGTLFLKSHPLMNTDPLYTKSMFVTNGKGIIRRPLRGRDTKVQQNIQAPDADLRKDQWLTELGLELEFERTQGYFGNIS